ncbi:MAG: DUF1588 domain-containing protein [Bryobacterales bacterium]
MRYYQLEGQVQVGDNGFHRVEWPDERRAGVLGFASVLAMTSHYKQPSPVLRGAWVLEKLLGTPVRSLLPDVPPLPEPKKGEELPMRAMLAQHRNSTACSACHNLMDPIGLGLENFDWMGRWRDTLADGSPVDATGSLPTGESFDGPAGLRQVLLDRKTDFLRQLVVRTPGYAAYADVRTAPMHHRGDPAEARSRWLPRADAHPRGRPFDALPQLADKRRDHRIRRTHQTRSQAIIGQEMTAKTSRNASLISDMPNRVTRRNVLRSAGIVLSLPWLESLADGAPVGSDERLSEPPVRLACMFVPNGVRPDHWTPPGDGEDYELTPHLEPPRAHKSEFLLLENLWNENTVGRNGHWPKVPAWLSGGFVDRTTGGDLDSGGTSVDQLLAQCVGSGTPLPSLELGNDAPRTGIDTAGGGFPRALACSCPGRRPTRPCLRRSSRSRV